MIAGWYFIGKGGYMIRQIDDQKERDML